MRLWLTVNPGETVEGYIQVQIGGIFWGKNFDFPKTFVGPNFPPSDDHVGIMLRRGWVAFKDGDGGKLRVGILDWHDSFGDTLASSEYEFDIGGVDWTKTYAECNDLKLTLGAFILSDFALVDSDLQLGNHDALLFTFDMDQPLMDKRYSVGFSTYYIADYDQYSYPTYAPYKSSWDLWVGARARANWETMPVNGFVVLNTGQRDPLLGGVFFDHTGWAGKFEVGPICFGPGKFSTQVLYTTGSNHPGVGDSGEFRTVAQTFRDNFGSQGYWSYLHLTSPNGPDDVKDLGVGLQNRGLGLFTAMVKYEYPICPKLIGIASAGWLRSDKANPVSNAKEMGTELANEFVYNFGYGLTVNFGGAFLFAGDFYKPSPTAPSPDNLFELFTRVQLEF
jgi:hypothetical protein